MLDQPTNGKERPSDAATAQRRHLPAAGILPAIALAVAVGAVSTLWDGSPWLGVGAAVGGLALTMALFIGGMGAMTFTLAAAGAFTVSMLSLRVGPVSLADTLFALSLIPTTAGLTRDPVNRNELGRYLPVAVLTCLTVAGGLGGSFTATDQVTSMAELGRFTASTLLLIVIIALWSPSREMVRRLMWIALLGVCVHVLIAMFIRDPNGRALGLATHPNHLGLSSALAIGLALGLVMSSRRRMHWALGGLALAILGLGIVMSGSRAAALAAAVTVVTFLIATRSWKLIAWGAVVLAVAAGLVTLKVVDLGEQNALTRLAGDRSAELSNRERVRAYDEALTAITENPLTGGGFTSAKAAHSIYLQLWVSAGLLGLVFVFGLGVVALKALLRARTRGDLTSLGLAAGYLGYLAAGFVTNQLWDRYIWLHLCLLLALQAKYRDSAATDPKLSDWSRAGVIPIRVNRSA
ncbi:MAG TPA: O-antigen ligase family protein [Actinomycetota bacterium]|jgi:O-antigen ligase|nr:O-antigen ligase family protein [Actinomycetota bacterium]